MVDNRICPTDSCYNYVEDNHNYCLNHECRICEESFPECGHEQSCKSIDCYTVASKDSMYCRIHKCSKCADPRADQNGGTCELHRCNYIGLHRSSRIRCSASSSVKDDYHHCENHMYHKRDLPMRKGGYCICDVCTSPLIKSANKT